MKWHIKFKMQPEVYILKLQIGGIFLPTDYNLGNAALKSIKEQKL